jgi:bifunctional non-homologous end joining protein LigD
MTVSAITHPEKVLDMKSGLSKQQLAEYYAAIAGHMLPHLADRPLSVVRCPTGTSKPCFFQKHTGSGLPDGIRVVAIADGKTGKKDDYLSVDSVEGLIGLAQMGVLEIHPWGSQTPFVDNPDRIVIDLDPDAAIEWETLTETALKLRTIFKDAGLKSFVKTTGSKGLHVVAPIRPEHEWPIIKDFAHRLVLQLEEEQPELYVTKASKAARKGHVYLDYLRNDREATSIAPFSPRARHGVPVAMPLSWDELKSAHMPIFPIADFAIWKTRLRRDPWRELPATDQSLDG